MRTLSTLGLVAALLAFGWAHAADQEKPKVGDTAPTFESTDDQGKTWKSADHVGKKIIVVYFFPADFTPGCTKQACGYRDDLKDLSDKGVEVVGISGDSTKNHEMFKKAYKLGFTLLADEEGAIAKKFGVPFTVGKKSYKAKDPDGKDLGDVIRSATIERWTFIIDKDGKLAYGEKVSDAGGNSKKILEQVEKLKK
jgi:peroxiredoxin Q/BCP